MIAPFLGLSTLASAAALPVSAASLPVIPSPTLREAAGDRLFVGAAINFAYLSGRGTQTQPVSAADAANYSAVAAAEFSILTCENALKSKQTEPLAPGVFNFTQGDFIVSFAKQHGVAVRGHNLVWVAHNPAWLVAAAPAMSPQQLGATMLAHVAGVAGHYAGKVYSWDVVNEGIVDVPKTHLCHLPRWQCALKASASSGEGVDWTRANNATGGGGGVTYVEAAFVAAHAADPGAKLFFNEYAVHGETTKFEYMFAMLADFVGRGVPCHGVGLQTHVQNAVAHKAWNETGFRNVLRRLTVGLGLEVHVTELNVPTDDPMYDACAAADAPCREGKLAALYVDVLRVCMEFAGCKSFETWGFTDAHSSYGARLKPPGAFLYDAAYAPKPVRAALAKQLASTPTPFPTPPPSPPTPAPPTPPPTPQVCAAAYGRCAGGPTWSGPTCCDGSCTCVVGNPTYSQCKPPAGSHAC